MPTRTADARSARNHRNLARWVPVVQQYFYYILAGEAVIVLLAGTWLFIWPAWEKYRDALATNQQTIATDQEQIADYDAKIARKKEVLAAYGGLTGSEQGIIAAMVPPAVAQQQLFAQLHTIAERNGVEVKSIAIESVSDGSEERSGRQAAQPRDGEVRVPEGIGIIEINASFQGVRYRSLQTLLDSLQRNARLIEVEAISFLPKEEEAELSIKMFYLPERMPAAPRNAPAQPDTTLTIP